MPPKKHKILIIGCGGTITMRPNRRSGALSPFHGAQALFELEPKLKRNFQLTAVNLANIDSTDMTPVLWQEIINTVQKSYAKFDGFVITMGTNTLAYCAAALSFGMQKLGKPVILTGAQMPLDRLGTDARNNFANAVATAGLNLAGVYVVFGSKVIRGCRAKKISESDTDAFGSYNEPPVADIGVTTTFRQQLPKRSSSRPAFRSKFDSAILSLTCIPGTGPQMLEASRLKGISGVILRGFGTGDIPQELIPGLSALMKKGLAVVVTTQCPTATTIMGMNQVGLDAVNAGVIEAYDMSMEAMSTKLMWLLGQGYRGEKVKKLMHRSMVGEISPARAQSILSQSRATKY